MGLNGLIEDAEQQHRPGALPRLKVAVVGAGGAGCNSIDAMTRMDAENLRFIAVNTDSLHMSSISADEKILIGKRLTKGRGAGGDPQIGEDSAVEAENEIRDALTGYDIVFLTGGLGGGTGTGSLPVIAGIAKKNRAMVIAIVSTPFSYEGGARKERAAEGMERLLSITDSTIVLDNNRLMEIAPDLPIDRAFMVMDTVISRVIKGIMDAITRPTIMNIDFSDFRNIMKMGGLSTVLYAENSDTVKLVSEAISSPFLDVDYSGARGALINIVGGKRLNMRQISQISGSFTKQLDDKANIAIGLGVDESLGSEIHLLAVLTGIPRNDMIIKNRPVPEIKMNEMPSERIAEMIR